MRRFVALLAGVLTFSSIPCAVGQESPTLTGYVTDPGVPLAFRVNDVPIVCTANRTSNVVTDGTKQKLQMGCPEHRLGELLAVYGKRDKKTGSIDAEKIEAVPIEEQQKVSGFAMIDRVLDQAQQGAVTVRADGYAIALTPATKIIFAESITKSGLDAITTNAWIQYAGTLHADGTVSAESAEITPNVIVKSEEKLRNKNEFDASTVTEAQRQGKVSKHFLGWDPKRIPAYTDEGMQKRITTIGERLVPAYQRDLPLGDPTKIEFRFQLVDQPKLLDEMSLPSGIVLVPYQVVQRLTDDAQLAAVLAAGVNEVLQKQVLRAIPGKHVRSGVNWAGQAAGLFLPGAGLATGLVTGQVQAAAQRRLTRQNCCVALALMQDAGFDLRQAPLAWWTLAQKPGKTLAKTVLPLQTTYTYELLATSWHSQL